MKIALVTSEVTYIPANYDRLIMPLMEHPSVCMLIEIKNRSPSLLLKGAALTLMGAKQVAKNLALNTIKTSTVRRRELAKKHDLHFTQVSDMNSDEAYELIKKYNIDLIINLRTRCIYRQKILEAPKLGCINVHHGILPKYRGTMCDLYALYENRAAGFSVHKMEKRVDAGGIYRVQEVSKGDLNYCAYLSKTNIFELNVLRDLIDEIVKQGKLPDPIPNQSNEKISYTKNPTSDVIKMMLAKGMKL